MRIVLLISLLALTGPAIAAQGDRGAARGTVVDMPASADAGAPETLPRRAMTMAQVEHRYGEPRARHDAVGEPPITRWDYAGFSVFFEHDRVLHAVVPGDFPDIRNRDELRP